MNHVTITASICKGIATLPDGSTVDLNSVQAALNEAFSETGESQYQEASDLVAKLTGQEQTARGFVASAGDDPEAMEPRWSDEHCTQAQQEGWDIFDTHGSDSGPWQLQRLDDASEFPGAKQLASDAEAWRLVFEGHAPHHVSAREFIRVHNPMEYEWALREYHPLRGLNAKGFFRKPAGYTIGGFTVGHAAKMSGNPNEATIVDVHNEDRLTVLLEFEEPQPVDVPEGATCRRISVPYTRVTSTWRKDLAV